MKVTSIEKLSNYRYLSGNQLIMELSSLKCHKSVIPNSLLKASELSDNHNWVLFQEAARMFQLVHTKEKESKLTLFFSSDIDIALACEFIIIGLGIKQMPNITSLELFNFPFQKEVGISLFFSLLKETSVVDYTFLSPLGLPRKSRGSTNFTYFLNNSDVNGLNIMFTKLSTSLKGLSIISIEDSFGRSSLDSFELPVSLNKCKNLKLLHFSNIALYDAELELILSSLSSSLEKLKIDRCKIRKLNPFLLKKCTNLKHLDLSHHRAIKNDVFLGICHSVLPQLEVLKLNGCIIELGKLSTETVLLFIQPDVAVAYYLRELEISSNPIEEEGLDIILRSFFLTLEKLICVECGILQINSMSLSKNRRLKILNLSRNKFKNIGFLSVLQSLRESLEQLSIEFCGITEIPKAELALMKKLKNLNISDNNIRNEGFQAILSSLWSKIESLNVCDCQITQFPKSLFLNCLSLKDFKIHVFTQDFDDPTREEFYRLIRILPKLNLNEILLAHDRFNDLKKLVKTRKFKVIILLCGIRNFSRYPTRSFGKQAHCRLLPIDIIKRLTQISLA